jgi:dipeptidyl aminopeptidase/acylaminoacyl peptidase
MTRRLIAGCVVTAVVLLGGRGVAQQKRLITENDLMKFTWIADPQISPDGSQVAFTRVTINESKNDYETSLWLVPASGAEAPRRLTAGGHDSSPRWSPDGRTIAFVRPVERDGRTQPAQIFTLALDGGEAHAVTDLPKGAGGPAWSPDGKRIAFSSTTHADEYAASASAREIPGELRRDLAVAASGREGGPAAPAPTGGSEPPKSDVRVITSAVYRSNGSGWNDPDRPTHLWVTEVTAGIDVAKALPLTSGKYDEDGAAWAPDGSKLYFTSDRVDEPYYRQSDADLYSVPASGGTVTKVASINGTIGGPRPSPDGKWIAFAGTLYGTPERSFDQSDLFVAAADDTGTPRNLTAGYDFDIGGSVGGDQRAPRGGGSGGAIWSADGRSLIIVSGEQGDANLVRVDVATSTVTPVFKRAHTVQSYTASKDSKALVAVTSTQTNINDLFVLDPVAGASSAKQITRINDDLFKNIRLSEPEEVWWTSFDGKKIQGWLLHPPDFDRSKQYPLILEIHGGPHSAYGNVFMHEFHWMAAKGYVVLFPNPRGSSNYGQDFGNIIQFHYPGDDYKDLMAGVDEVVKRGYIDTKRMGVTGGSGGGLLTNWTITQTTRFAAAVSMRSIADWSGFWYTADFSQYTPSWFRKAPWEDPADFTARSPITYVAKVKTPLMLIDGDDDLRTPPADGGEMMFRALKYLKVPTVMVRVPGETHELSRSGKPRHRVERLQHILGWFDKWLQGKPVATYDTGRQ